MLQFYVIYVTYIINTLSTLDIVCYDISCKIGTMLPVTILIPAYQPATSLPDMVAQLANYVHSIIIVNDGSTSNFDTIFDAIKPSENVHLIRHDQNSGKGAALKTGMHYWMKSLSHDSTGIITADADGQHGIDDIHKLSKALHTNPKNLHLGVRTFSNTIPLRSFVGNQLTKWVFYLLTKQKITDTQTGLRALPHRLISQASQIQGDHYEYEMNLLIYAIKQKWAIAQHPIETIYLDNNSTSHFRPILDSIKIYTCLIKSLIK